jgi:hypothetical protein
LDWKGSTIKSYKARITDIDTMEEVGNIFGPPMESVLRLPKERSKPYYLGALPVNPANQMLAISLAA